MRLRAEISTVIVLCVLAFASTAWSEAVPMPDAAPNPEPDAAPVLSSSAPAPVYRQPTIQAPSPGTPEPTPARSSVAGPASAARHAARLKARRVAARARAAHAARVRRAQARRLALAQRQRAAQVRALTAQQPRVAVTATHRMATLLFVDTSQATSGPSLPAGELFAAGTLLLLFVGAAASVLRLSARVSRDVPAGRLVG